MPESALRRYQRSYGLASLSDSRKDVEFAVKRHFSETIVNETDSIAYFVYAIRNIDKVYKLCPKFQ
eukprot:jgi/Hompol1/2417/HPOL_001808-RA